MDLAIGKRSRRSRRSRHKMGAPRAADARFSCNAAAAREGARQADKQHQRSQWHGPGNAPPLRSRRGAVGAGPESGVTSPHRRLAMAF
jgi:hypothetical protein